MVKETSEFNCGNCAACPRVKLKLAQARAMSGAAEMIADQAMSDMPDEFAEMLFESISHYGQLAKMTPEGARPVESAEELASSFRTRTAEFLEALDGVQEEIENDIAVLTDGCEKPLSMRAKRGGEVIVATVCMSPTLELGRETEPVMVNRQRQC